MITYVDNHIEIIVRYIVFLSSEAVVAENATTESSFNSSDLNTFFMCLEMVDLLL